MMNRTLLLGLAAAGLVSAKATVTSMFIFDTDPQPLAASIIGNASCPCLYQPGIFSSTNRDAGCDRDNLQYQLPTRHRFQ